MTTPNVIDISQWQGTGSSIDFANLKSNGIKAVIIRLGHGTTTDPSAKSFITAVQKAGLRIHGYHYYEGVSGELEFTIKNASSLGLPLESYYFLDMEGKISGNWADIFRTYYTSWLQVGRRVGLYVSDSPYKQYFDDNELTGHGVYRWIASYSYEPTNYDTWQFNSQGGWGNYTSNLDKDYDKTGYLINGSATIKPKDDSDPDKKYQVVAGAFVGFDYSTTKLQGGQMMVYSPNGVDKIPAISPRGLEFDQPAADRLWPYLKKYVGGNSGTTTITGSLKWADILDKPDLVTESELNQRIANIASSGQITSLDWGQVTNKPDLVTKEDLDKISSSAGKSGKDGKSAYEIAVDHGFVGSEEDWLQSLHGKDGTSSGTKGDDSLSIEAITDLIKQHLSAKIDVNSGNLAIDVNDVSDGSIADSVAVKIAQACQFKLENGDLVLQMGGV